MSALISVWLSALFTIYQIGGYNQAQVSALFPTSITPATYTFAIWSVIYLSWIALGIFIAQKNIFLKKENIWLFTAAQMLSSLWLIPSQSLHIFTSFIVMLAIAFALTLTFFNSQEENIYFRYVNQLFYGWILIALLANFHQTLIFLNLYLFPTLFGVFTIICALGINLYFLFRYNALIINAVYIWAAIWISLGADNILISFLALLSAWFLVLAMGGKNFSSLKKKKIIL